MLFKASADSAGNPDLAVAIGRTPILPRHYWETRDITKTSTQPPLGSGPYRVGAFDFGRNITFYRVEDYWGKDLPVNRGRYNFEHVKFDYFRDESIMLEALKGDVIDVRNETLSKIWATGYGFPAVKAGFFKKELIDLGRPRGPYFPLMWNLDKVRFQDIRVREALWLLYDFRWLNRVLMYGFYRYADSFFFNSPMAQHGLPSSAELKLLRPWRGKIPGRVFTHRWRDKKSTGYGYNRDALKRALVLFEEAGWVLRDAEMVNARTGEPFTVDFVHASPASIRTEGTFMQILNRIGIRTTMRVPEISNWLYRIRSGKFDVTTLDFSPGNRPGHLLRTKFGSASADEPWGQNWGNIRDPAVDAMIEHVIAARTPDDFYAATRALDRILLWNFYCIPALAAPGHRLVYWNRFGIPADRPRLQRVAWLDTWWWDADKEAWVESGMAALTGKGR